MDEEDTELLVDKGRRKEVVYKNWRIEVFGQNRCFSGNTVYPARRTAGKEGIYNEKKQRRHRDHSDIDLSVGILPGFCC